MKGYVFAVLALALAVGGFACGKKETPPVELQEAMSLDALDALNANMTVVSYPDSKKLGVPLAAIPEAVKAIPEKPSEKEIQTALKNARYYTGAIDGKIGPKSRKAIEDFQKENGLSVDGKVGPKTWAVLGKYLNAAPSQEKFQLR